MEQKFDFDRVIDRRNTWSIKYDMEGRGKPENVLPLWVADMDFPAPDCVLEALEKQVKHGIFGYSDTDAAYFETLYDWFEKRFGWKTEFDWLVKTPGVVNAIFTAVRALTEKNDSILIQQPVYYPFMTAAQKTGRRLIVSELVNGAGFYGIDFDDFENQILQNKVKLFILCNPHNPVGRVWTRAELTRMGEICVKHGVLVISDEIHQDIVYSGHRHLPFAGLCPEFQKITVTCTAPSKTFNLAGLHISNIFIADSGLRDRFTEEFARTGLSQLSVMGIAACQAAYRGGEAWLRELLVYLEGNMMLIEQAMDSVPTIAFRRPEGTYLAWLDLRAFNMNPRKLDQFITREAGLWLSGGAAFGPSGEGFMRLNAACPRSLLREALRRLTRSAAEKLK
ncbi:MAG: pyridoxal phosphate-dependent aminotransferase [Clostridiales bacterium]|jgi:cystathionine beta-lyase|nr:pyridoxal phosphate-dependent aminotransferase [Clostridiales bacterium]